MEVTICKIKFVQYICAEVALVTTRWQCRASIVEIHKGKEVNTECSLNNTNLRY